MSVHILGLLGIVILKKKLIQTWIYDMLSVRASHWPGHLLHLLLIGCLSCLADPCPVCYGSVPIYKHGQSRDIVRQMSKTRHDLGHGSAAPRLFLFHIETINYHSHSVRDSQRLSARGKVVGISQNKEADPNDPLNYRP